MELIIKSPAKHALFSACVRVCALSAMRKNQDMRVRGKEAFVRLKCFAQCKPN